VAATQTHYIVVESEKNQSAKRQYARAVGKKWEMGGKRAAEMPGNSSKPAKNAPKPR